MARATEKFISGNVSRTVLLTILWPLSCVALFGSLSVGAWYMPVHYVWSTRIISDITSPRVNPDYYWIPTIGVALASILVLPFGRYIERRLQRISPMLARAAAIAFTVGCICMLLACIPVPSHKPTLSARTMRKFHELSARGCALGCAAGMAICSWAAYKDRRGQRLLHPALFGSWTTLVFSPIAGLGFAGVLALGHIAHLAWADTLRAWFRQTPMWHTAFWEWVAYAVYYAFMLITFLLLPGQVANPPTLSQPAEHSSVQSHT